MDSLMTRERMIECKAMRLKRPSDRETLDEMLDRVEAMGVLTRDRTLPTRDVIVIETREGFCVSFHFDDDGGLLQLTAER